MRTVVAAVCISIAFGVCADEYDECVLAGIKGVSSDTGARFVAQACKNKIKETQKSRRASFGNDINPQDYRLITGENSVQRHEDGTFSQVFENQSSVRTITYVALTIRDGDYYDFKPAGGKGQDKWLFDPFDNARVLWERNRTRVYYYKVVVKPGKTLRLKFPSPKSDTFYSEIAVALGRESKLSDTIQQFKDAVIPEERDPLE